MLTVGDVVAGLDARLVVRGDPEVAASTMLTGVAFDSRECRQGVLFAALQGSREHGIVHGAEAFDRSAACILAGPEVDVSQLEALADRGPVIVTGDDPVTSLGTLAGLWRREAGFRVVAVTGSSGKTSTKDILATLLADSLEVVASLANYNNELGAALTLLNAPATCDVVIVEMGMRGEGQIDYLCGFSEPDVGIVTNVGQAHLELLGTRGAIVRAKAELVAGIWPGGTAIVPAGQPEILEAARRQPTQVLTFGPDVGADCGTRHVTRVPGGIQGTLSVAGVNIPFRLPVHGVHQAQNLAAAVCAMTALGCDPRSVSQACAQVQLGAGRGSLRMLDGGVVAIDDAYNANPESMRVALEELSHLDVARRIAVLGGMAELGSESPALHEQVGRRCAELGIDELVVVASLPEGRFIAQGWKAVTGVAAAVVGDAAEAALLVSQMTRAGDGILVKASNAVGMGGVVDELARRRSRAGEQASTS